MFTPYEVQQNYLNVAKSKTEAKWYRILFLAIFAGAFIAIGATTATFASATATVNSNAIKAAVFPVGLILVVLFGAELFTGNCLLIAPAADRKIKPLPLLKNLSLAYLGNLIGGVLIAVLVVYSGVQSGAVEQLCIETAANKCNLNFGEALLRGILCNMLVCLAVLASMSAKSAHGKIIALYMPIFAFVICGFEHSVANMYYLTAGLLSGHTEGLTVGNAILFSLIPSTLGNIIGGAIISLSLYYLFRPKKTDVAD